MVTKRLSALAGFLLLIGCVVGIVLIMYGGDSTRTSSKSRPKETFTSWESKDNLSGSLLHDSQPSLQEVYQLADDLEKLFSKNSNGDQVGTSQNSKKSKPKTKPPESAHAPHSVQENIDGRASSYRSSTPIPTVLDGERNAVRMMTTTPRKEIVDEMEGVIRNDFPTSPWIPSTNPKLYQRNQVEKVSYSNGPSETESEITIPMETSSGNENVRVINSQMEDTSNSDSHQHTQQSWQDEDMEDDSETSEEEGNLDEDQYVSEREDDQPDPVLELGELFDLAANLYASGPNSSSLQGFIRVLNDTVNRGNNSGLLAQLNELYSRPESSSSLSADVLKGRNAYETSLTAFVFMSFGVFLLSQIHGFVGEESKSQSRNFQTHSHSHENFDLNVLFEPPNALRTPAENHSGKNGQSSQSRELRDHLDSLSPTNNGNDTNNSTSPLDPSDNIANNNSTFFSPNYVNNMFRALLNLVNAYSKNPQELECIWSLYCRDLDKTAAKQGLYGIAARINSIGLRLIMDQIPAELTLDVMLRSLLGWDGLPCMKMFPKCQAENAIVTLQAATSDNNPSLQTT